MTRVRSYLVGVAAVFLLLSSAGFPQKITLTSTITVMPGYPATSECRVTMDPITFASSTYVAVSYPMVGVQCYEYVNNSLVQPIPYATGRPEAYAWGQTTWVPPNTYSTQQDSYLYFSTNGGSYLDPLGYQSYSICTPGNPMDVCPANFFLDPFPSYVQFPRIGTQAESTPSIAVVTPSYVNLNPGGAIQFHAYEADGAGNATSTPAPVTWAMQLGGVGGSINTSGIYTAPSTINNYPAQDIVVALGSGGTKTTAVVNFVDPSPHPTIGIGTWAQNACLTPVTGPQVVYVGQKISMTGCFPNMSYSTSSPPTLSWTPPPNVSDIAVAGFTVTSAPDPSDASLTAYNRSLTNVSPTSCSGPPYCQFNEFYFVLPGKYIFSFTYSNPGNPAPTPATIEFDVSGPSSDPANPGLDAIAATSVGSPRVIPGGTYLDSESEPDPHPWLASGNKYIAAVGIRFQAQWFAPDANSGQFSWVQIANSNKYKALVNTPTVNSSRSSSGLDSLYPYTTGADAEDTPGTQLEGIGFDYQLTQYEVTLDQSFTMYLMWTPSAANNCSGNCVIPVPLGSLPWTHKSSTYNTLDPNQGVDGWVLEGCSKVTPGAFQPSAGSQSYPVWSNTLHN